MTRPWPTDIRGILFIPALLENAVILVLICLTILRPHKLSQELRSFMWFAITFTIILFSIIGITTPIIGAIVRYKIPALPFLFILLLIAIRSTVLDNRIEPFLTSKEPK
jgi:hypothetical protein